MAASAWTTAKATYSCADSTTPPGLYPAQAEMGAARRHPTESPDAARGLPDDCAPLQSAMEIEKTDDGQ
jgi:hypothetical protein